MQVKQICQKKKKKKKKRGRKEGKVAVYEISTEITDIELDKTKIKNINELFNFIVNNRSKHSIVLAQIKDSSSILAKYKENPDFEIKEFAKQLFKAEMTGDHKRSKSIRDGYIFIKETQNGNDLLLLKLEKTSGADTNTFEMLSLLGTDNSYYKACIFHKNSDDIEVIDKNNTVAKYWLDKFLGLEEQRNQQLNTIELIEYLKSDNLFSEDIKKNNNFIDIKEEIQNYIFENRVFDKLKILEHLNRKEYIDIDTSKSDCYSLFFSSEATELDSEFTIDYKVISKEYGKIIKVSDMTKIHTENFKHLKRKGGIRYCDGEIILTVESEMEENIKELFGN